jgi:hypothetical protein
LLQAQCATSVSTSCATQVPLKMLRTAVLCCAVLCCAVLCCAVQLKAASFPSVCEELMRRYHNALLKPSHAANALRLQLLSGGPAWSHDELAAALADVKGVEEVKVSQAFRQAGRRQYALPCSVRLLGP